MTAAAASPDRRRRLLTRPETAALIDQVRAGDSDAMADLIAANEGLVVSVANGYRSRLTHLVEWDDLLQAARIAMIKAARVFDARRGVAFSTLATVAMKREIERTLDNHSRSVRIPVSSLRALRRINYSADSLQAQLGRTPAVSEIADRAGLRPATIDYVLQNYSEPEVCLDAPEHENTVAVEPMRDLERDGDSADRRALLAQAMEDRLDSRSAALVRARFGLDGRPMNIDGIAAKFGMSRGNVLQALALAMQVLATDERVQALRAGEAGESDVLLGE